MSKKRVNVTAIETKCGFQPFFELNKNNYTVGIDGCSVHPFSSCFWKSHLVNLNGKTYIYAHTNDTNDWVEELPTIHVAHINLISEFEELPLKDFNFQFKAHPAHDISDLEQLNILNELIGRIEDSDSISLSNIVSPKEHNNEIASVFSWSENLKIKTFRVIGFILFLICIRIFISLNPFPKLIKTLNDKKGKSWQREKGKENEGIEHFPMIPTAPMQSIQLSPPANIPNKALTLTSIPFENEPNEMIHSHNHCTYVVGKGLVWEDLCPCN